MNRQKIISFKVTTNEQQLLDILAKRENRTVSEMVRECIREAAATRNLLPVGLINLDILQRANNGQSTDAGR